MRRLVKPSAVRGVISAPPSKSVAQRAIAIASLANGESVIFSPGKSDDVISAIQVCSDLGARIETEADKLIINGGISTPNNTLNCGESGLGIRMFSAIAATLNQPVTLTGTGTLKNRPMGIIEQSLQQLGVDCNTTNGTVPISVKGPIARGFARIDGSKSSQVLSGILIAAPLAQNDLTVRVENLQSKPYIDLTIDVMKKFGVEVLNENYETFTVKAGSRYIPTKFAVEGDWSGAAFMLVAGAIAGRVKVENLLLTSKQVDRAIVEVLMQIGAKISIFDDGVEVCKQSLFPFHFDATNCPDLFPPLVALAAHCKGESRILGVSRLRSKESDRAKTLQEEFAKLGVDIKINGELMQIFGGKVMGGEVQSHDDHRIAMSCAVAALAAEGEVLIENADAVNKSYPNFFEDLYKLATNPGI